MRLPYGHRRSARHGQRHGAVLTLLTTVTSILANAATPVPAPPANLDFSQLGQIGIAGDFGGISLYQYVGQGGQTRSANGSQALLSELPNGALLPAVQTDAAIRALCLYNATSSKTNGIIIGGNFTSLGGKQSKAIGIYDVDASKVTTLDGLEGEVNAILCDDATDTVYIGGNFKSGNSTNAISWNSKDGFKNLPFVGFNGPVAAITKMDNGHILFGGSFTGLGNYNTTNDSWRDSQTINLATAKINAQGSSSKAGFSDPANVVCSSGSDAQGSTWLLQDDSPGYWEAQFGFGFEPTKIRIWNTHIENYGTKTFNIQSFPNGLTNIMNMTYVDPSTGKNATCDRLCPLSNDPKIQFQDFYFVNVVGMDKIRIDILDWFGTAAGLAGVQIFEDNIFSYAINEFNEPKCRTKSGTVSSASTVGPWQKSPAFQSNAQYLTARISVNDGRLGSNASVTFYPNVPQSGNYSINLYTPGCIADGTCANRGRVYVSGSMSSGTAQPEFETQLFQTNNFDKYDQIYFGFVEKTSDKFQASVTLSPAGDQTVQDLVVVAQQVGFTLINSVGGLNGLFDFDPQGPLPDERSLDSSAINKLGYSFDKSSGVKALTTSSDTTYIAGNFSSKSHRNILAISSKGGEAKNLNGGLNGRVVAMQVDNSKLYVGGSFSNTLSNDTKGINNVAVYDPDSDTWSPLGAGVDGSVDYVVLLRVNTTEGKPETVIAFTGAFTHSNGYGTVPSTQVDGVALWVPSQNIWLHNSEHNVPRYSGTLSASYLDLRGNNSLLAGSIDVSTLAVDGVASLTSDGLGKFPVKIDSKAPSSSKRQRSLGGDGGMAGVSTGTFYENTDESLTILAGHFTVQGQNNDSTIHNLVFIDAKQGNKTSGLPDGINDNSSFIAVDLWKNILFAGGQVSGKVNGMDAHGIIAWDLDAKQFSHQPAGLTGGDGVVTSIAVRPSGGNQVFVGGSFEKAGALDCPGLCVFNIDDDQWTRPGTVITGQVTGLQWISTDSILVAGDLVASSSGSKPLAYYNPVKQTWTDFPRIEEVPGPVAVITPASMDLKQFWIGGTSLKDNSTFLMKWDGSNWRSVEQKLPNTTVLRSIQVFQLTKSHDRAPLLETDQALMITGAIDLPNTGSVSACLFNGSHYVPYALTTSNNKGTGSIGRIFSQRPNKIGHNRHMPLVFIVLIGLAISLALILLMVVGGVVLDRLRKKREGYVRAPTSMRDRGSGIQRVPPRELLESLGRVRPGGSPAV
ncbi:Galactose oxidase/kelch, beta-propeller [Cordyceps fumosorosea ARSEF 2679]|uniref:Galactose oxidase/kelch, beta-propeller n=1 Tax=Cordyceps fumosorosea (strain ARSEF 2679) TaxID=1081104 RepID=A0A167ZK53_CORFA|nr:Galactose oxidase/kelch, beta-propeller [Cordyceps fumosorosea ARSEF 2679]OAA67611.1 Galactose oxidase/kelch, beta-propeller [Cordyceps fumosorosea ARSEF 2679]